MVCTQIEKYGPVLARKHWKSLEDGGSLSAGFFTMISGRFLLKSTGSCQESVRKIRTISGRDTASMIQRLPVFSWRIQGLPPIFPAGSSGRNLRSGYNNYLCFSSIPRSDSTAKKRSVASDSGDFTEAVFRARFIVLGFKCKTCFVIFLLLD